MAEYGFVYCLSNPGMPGVYKIGFTRGSPHLRAQQLSAPTGVPAPFEIEWYVESDAADALEKSIHDQFSFERICSGREFFRVCPVEVFESIGGRSLSEWMSADYQFRSEKKKKSLALVG